MSSEVFDLFEGKKPGIQKCLRKQICQQLDCNPDWNQHQAELEQETGLNPGTIAAIVEGDASRITTQVLSALAGPLDLRIDEALQLVNFTSTAKKHWRKKADAEQFVILAGADKQPWTQDKRTELFVRLTALNSL